MAEIFMTREDTRAEWAAAEAALAARRDAAQLAGAPTAAEAAEIAAADELVARAAAATQAAAREFIAAEDVPAWRRPSAHEQARYEAAARALERARSDEADVRGEWVRLHVRIDAACQARREAAER